MAHCAAAERWQLCRSTLPWIARRRLAGAWELPGIGRTGRGDYFGHHFDLHVAVFCSREEYSTLLEALVAEHKPQGTPSPSASVALNRRALRSSLINRASGFAR